MQAIAKRFLRRGLKPFIELIFSVLKSNFLNIIYKFLKINHNARDLVKNYENLSKDQENLHNEILKIKSEKL